MNNNDNESKKLLDYHNERIKELRCIEQVNKLLKNPKEEIGKVLKELVNIIPQGMQYPEYAQVRIIYLGRIYHTKLKNLKQVDPPDDLSKTLQRELLDSGLADEQKIKRTIGNITVFYTRLIPEEKYGPFLEEEFRLLELVTRKLNSYLRFTNYYQSVYGVKKSLDSPFIADSEWRTIIGFVSRMDHDLFLRISRKMLNYLCWNGIQEATNLLMKISSDNLGHFNSISHQNYQPSSVATAHNIKNISDQIFEIASRYLPDNEIFMCVQKWMQEDRSSFLTKTLVNINSSIGEVSNALRRFVNLVPMGVELSDSTRQDVIVGLIQKLITDQLDYTKIARKYLEIEDFKELADHLIFPQESHGHIGGKGAGIILAGKIIKRRAEWDKDFESIKLPKTWYITTDGIYSFLRHNNLEEVSEQKYKNHDQVKQEYQHIVQLFKNSSFTSDLVHGLSVALDDFGEVPIVVRSSSSLEDRFSISFTGKYKTLFLANQGSKSYRLEMLMSAIAEIYATVFSADPISYRRDNGLLEFKEEMGIIIQEVIGKQAGEYFLPLYSVNASSIGQVSYLDRISFEDSLIRLVAGLSTHATERFNNDNPMLISLPINSNSSVRFTDQTQDNHYQNSLDVINLEKNRFETVEAEGFFKQYGGELPFNDLAISVQRDGKQINVPSVNMDMTSDTPSITFHGLLNNTDFLRKIKKYLNVLKETFRSEVEIEFASDGTSIYLLQCRTINIRKINPPPTLTKNVESDAFVFSGTNCILNSDISVISHIIYIQADCFGNFEQLPDLYELSLIIGKLNRLLPPRNFIIMASAMFGSKGDQNRSVPVTYSDISNTAALIEFDLPENLNVLQQSIGSNFFNDLLESNIQYIQIIDNDDHEYFNRDIINQSQNNLAYYLPDYQSYENFIKVVDVQRETKGQILRIVASNKQNEAIGLLRDPAI